MALALFSVVLLQAELLPRPPVTDVLRQARGWSVWQAGDLALFDQATKMLQKRDFKQAVQLNRTLLSRAPQSIFDDPPTLPTILIRPSGSDMALPPERPVSGWKWRLESAWLSCWAGDHVRSLSEFKAVMGESPREAIPAVEGALFTLSRLKRWEDCLSLCEQTKVGGPSLKAVYALASRGRWEDLRNTALGVTADQASQAGGYRPGVPSPTLSGTIGGKGRVLPSPSQPPLLPRKKPLAGPSWASVEASLIILDSKVTSFGQAKASQSLKQSALFWVNILLRDAKEAFPHHRQAAYSALNEIKK